uniref:Neuralized E3 ubiquitin protein ligase 1Ab n=1 Tax=Pundamilia nyererei TaxID=303518 RepID=A0A3B4FCZ5_9CICH
SSTPCGNLSSFPLLFHPSTKGSQIVMDMSQRTVKRQASFCNAITFSNRPIAVYEQVRLKVNDCCWSGALRLGFTSKDPSRINPDTLPKYACPDLVSQSGFWAKALPEELSNEGNVISQWLIRIKRMLCIVLIPLCPFDLLQPKHAILRDSTKLLSIITISLALLLMRSAVKQLNCSQVLF